MTTLYVVADRAGARLVRTEGATIVAVEEIDCRVAGHEEIARSLAAHMTDLREAGTYEDAVLVAESALLALLRDALDEQCACTVRAVLVRDLSDVETPDLPECLGLG